MRHALTLGKLVAADLSAPGENEQPAERKVLALHRQSLAQSVSKLLADAGALDEFNNLSNPLFGTQQSVTGSHASFALQMPGENPADIPVPGALHASRNPSSGKSRLYCCYA